MALSDRQTLIKDLPQVPAPPHSFVHEPPENKPSRPDVETGLTAPELEDYLAWYDSRSDYAPHTPTLANAVTAQTTYQAYLNANLAWKTADFLARDTQWRALYADAQGANFPTVAPTSVASGTGSDAPPEEVPHFPT